MSKYPRSIILWAENLARLAWLRSHEQHVSANRIINLALAHYANARHAEMHPQYVAGCILCEEKQKEETK